MGHYNPIHYSGVALFLEPVSKPSEHDHHTGKFGEAVEKERIEFVAGDQPAEVLQPGDGSLDDPAVTEATQRSTVLCWRLHPPAAMRADQLDPAGCQSLAEWIAVGGAIVDETPGNVRSDRLVNQRLDQIHLGWAGAVDIHGQRQTASVDKDHELGALAAFGGTNAITPFFAEANVPSAIPSSQSTAPCRSSCLTSLRQAVSQIPSTDQSANRRQQVAYEGKQRGRSFQREPLLSTHRMPSRQSRASALGRPPRGSGGGSGKRSAMSAHCSSSSCGRKPTCSGSILDPALSRDREHIEETPFVPLLRSGLTRGLASKSKF